MLRKKHKKRVKNDTRVNFGWNMAINCTESYIF